MTINDNLICYLNLFAFSSPVLYIVIKIFLPIVIFVMIITTINILYKYSKYKSKLFPNFKKAQNPNYQRDIIVNSIEEISGYRKVIKLINYYSDLLIIDETGLYLVLYYNQAGTLKGFMNNKKLTLKRSEYSYMDISNPFKMILEDEKKLTKKFGINITKKYIIFNNNCNVQVQGIKDIETVFLRNFNLALKKELNSNDIKRVKVDECYNELIESIH